MNLVMNPSAGLFEPPPYVGWKALPVVGKSAETVSPAT